MNLQLATHTSPLPPLKVTFLTVMPSPYVQDLFSALAQDARIDLTVWYLEQVAPDTYWGEQKMPPYAEVLPGRWFGISGARIHWNPGIRKRIRDSDADLFVIVGYIGLTNQLAMRALNRSDRPWVFWGEIPGLHKRGRVGSLIRRLIQRPLKHAAGIAGVGTHAVAAYRQLSGSASAHQVYCNLPYYCRLDHFEAVGTLRKPSAGVRFLYCGQLIHRKGVDLLMQAFTRLATECGDVTLTLAGDGPLSASLKSDLDPRIAARVSFAGFHEVDELPAIFGANDVFVLPSRHDGWGVVVNQAIAAGMPVIATTAVGAANDLVETGINGLRITPDSAEDLYEAMKWMIADCSRMAAMGRRSREIAAQLSLGCAVKNWTNFCAAALSQFSARTTNAT